MKWMVLSWWQKKISVNPMWIFSVRQVFRKNNRSYGYAMIFYRTHRSVGPWYPDISRILDKRRKWSSKTWKSWLQSCLWYFGWGWENKIEIQQISIKLCPSVATSTRTRRTNSDQLNPCSIFLFYFLLKNIFYFRKIIVFDKLRNMNRHGEDESCILWCGNLNDECTEEILFGTGEVSQTICSLKFKSRKIKILKDSKELFLQAGPLVSVKKPKEKTFAFVTFKVKFP